MWHNVPLCLFASSTDISAMAKSTFKVGGKGHLSRGHWSSEQGVEMDREARGQGGRVTEKQVSGCMGSDLCGC